MHSLALGLLFSSLASGAEPTPPADPSPRDPFTRALAAGGNEKVTPDQAIEAGLVWLARHQFVNGLWSTEAYPKVCKPALACSADWIQAGGHYDVGITGLAALAFLRAGHLPSSKKEFGDADQGRHVGGDVVLRALTSLKKQQHKDGHFTKDRAFLYNEAIATLAFAEADASDPDGGWRECTERAVKFLVDAQRKNPSGSGMWGWRYASRAELEAFQKPAKPGDEPSDFEKEQAEKELSDADTSVTGWAVEALRAAQRAGIAVPETAIDGALDFLEYVSKTDGLVGYVALEGAGVAVTGTRDVFKYHVGTMSALGMIILWDGERENPHPFFQAAAKQIVKDLPTVSKDKLSVDYYYWYHGSVALNDFDAPAKGKKQKLYADPWNKALIEASIAVQDRTKGACTHGGWIVGDRWAYAGGSVYATALNVLALEACTRPEPAQAAPPPKKK